MERLKTHETHWSDEWVIESVPHVCTVGVSRSNNHFTHTHAAYMTCIKIDVYVRVRVWCCLALRAPCIYPDACVVACRVCGV